MDYMIRATAYSGSIRIFAATTKNTVNDAFKIHKTSPVASAALGRVLTAAALMGRMLKNSDDIITINIKGDGPLKGIVVTGDAFSNVKGYALESIVDLPLKPNGKLDVSGAIGEGSLTVIKDLGLKEPYVSQMPLVSGEIAEDLTYYFAKSEQTPSAVALGVLVDRDYTIRQAGGFIIQILPGAEDGIITALETRLGSMPPITSMLDEGMLPEDIMERLVGDGELNILEKTEIKYFCDCSRGKVEKALIAIGREELGKIIEEDKKATLHCHFCQKDYEFNEDDLKGLLKV